MPKLMQNKLKWKAELLNITQGKDSNDRPKTIYELNRIIFYEEAGVTAQEKYLSLQAKTEVVRKIKVRWDKNITEKFNAIRIGNIDYNITRIYSNLDKREMELSLAYVS